MELLTTGQHFGENTSNIRLNGLLINEAMIKMDANVPWHYHENAYFLYAIKGQFIEANKKEKIYCTPNTLLYHNSQDPHYNTEISNVSNYFHLEIENNWYLKHELKPDAIEGSLVISNPDVKSIFQRIHQKYKRNDFATTISIEGLLLQAIASIVREKQTFYTDQPLWVKRIKEIIHEELPETLSLKALAKMVDIHPVHLSRSFPIYFRKSLGDYIRDIKTEQAANLLRTGTMSITEIAYEFRFADESHFIKVFKSRYGSTPRQYRKSFQKG